MPNNIPKYLPDGGVDGKINEAAIYIDGKKVRVGELFAINDTDISKEFANQSARFAYVGTQAAKAEAAYEEAKAAAELLKAQIDRDIRSDPIFIGRKPTETAIAQMVVEDEGYQEALDLERDRYRDWKVLKAISDAMRQRGDMLVSLGATLRQEFEITDLSMRESKDRLRK